jgi:DNA-binding HxlR family transcriptional regulator
MTTRKSALRLRPRAGNLYDGKCATRGVLDHITSRWGMLILILLIDRTLRFSELAREIGGVSEKMLAQSLRALEDDGFVLRTVYPTKPPSVEYSLTPLGTQLAPHVRSLTTWVEKNLSAVLTFREKKHLRKAS